MSSAKQDRLRGLPSVESLLNDPSLRETTGGVPRAIVTNAVRWAVQQTREHLVADPPPDADARTLRRTILDQARARIRATAGPHYRRVVNAAGIILHTGLGRAVLPDRAMRQIQQELSAYSLLQLDVDTGDRDRRDGRIEWLLQQITGAEAATVVNNNAAATMIVLNTIGAGREIIVSRGQLIEIGGSFRLPDVMAASGARLVEVGTTNKTHARDYVAAITENTAAILRVHPSNYRITGFASSVPTDELAAIAHAHGLVMIDDVGAGALVDFSRFGFEHEPTLPESIRAGADLVLSSADKLIGGPQGGVIVGRAEHVRAIRRNPLARIVRVDKLTLAALEATLTLFLDEETALAEVPTLRMLQQSVADLGERADAIAGALLERVSDAPVAVIDGFSQMGSGSLPGQDLATRLLAVAPTTTTADALARELRLGAPPIFVRISKDRVLIDPRTLLPGDDQIVVDALAAALTPTG